MSDWGVVEVEPEVASWLTSLSDSEFGRAMFYIDLLQQEGPLLSEPYTRQLQGKLRELRFYIGSQSTRISYFIASGRRIVLLTVFRKAQPREPDELKRAARAMERCIAEQHTTSDEEGD